MSYCSLKQIGSSADLTLLGAVASLIDKIAPHSLFTAETSWIVKDAPVTRRGRETIASTKFFTLELSKVSILGIDGEAKASVTDQTGNLVYAPGREYSIPEELGSTFGSLDIEYTGKRGWSTLRPIDTGTALDAGQSVLRSGNITLIQEDSTSVKNDQLIVPFPLLTRAAIGIGRRLLYLELDEESDFSKEKKDFNSLTDVWEGEIRAFARRWRL